LLNGLGVYPGQNILATLSIKIRSEVSRHKTGAWNPMDSQVTIGRMGEDVNVICMGVRRKGLHGWGLRHLVARGVGRSQGNLMDRS
jgi:hypothetical protein